MALRFVAVKESHLEKIMSWRMDPDVTKYMYTDPVLTLETQAKWYAAKVRDNPLEKYWVINCDGVDIGLVSISGIDHVNKRASWAYYIGNKEYLGRGIGKAVELNVLEYVFAELKLNKLCCEVFSFNEKVVEIHKKYGSVVEGIYREHICKNGRFYDVVFMSILKSEWEKAKHLHLSDKIRFED